MGNIGTGLVIMLTIQAMLMLGQASLINLNPDANSFYTGTGSMLSSFDEGNYTLTTADPLKSMPGEGESVTESRGNFFTDTYEKIKNWISDTAGVRYVVSLLRAPETMLNVIGLPAEFTFALAAIWYGTMLFFIISWLLGRVDN